jgi:hypothetical protein
MRWFISDNLKLQSTIKRESISFKVEDLDPKSSFAVIDDNFEENIQLAWA